MGRGTVHLSEKSNKELDELAKQLDLSKTKVVSKALKELRRKEFFKQLAEDAVALRADPEASKEYDEEFEAWDVTLADGMDGF